MTPNSTFKKDVSTLESLRMSVPSNINKRSEIRTINTHYVDLNEEIHSGTTRHYWYANESKQPMTS
jgi:hypothetical protein